MAALLLGVPGVEINCRSALNERPLHLACQNGHAHVVSFVLGVPGNLEDRWLDAARREPSPARWSSAGRALTTCPTWPLSGSRTPTLARRGVSPSPATLREETIARSQGRVALADYFACDVHAAGGFLQYRAEPRLQLVLMHLHALSLRGRATSAVDDHFKDEAAVAAAATPSAVGTRRHARQRRLLYVWLLGAAPPARCDDDDDDGGASAALAPCLAGMSGGTDTRHRQRPAAPLRLSLEFRFRWAP